MFLPQVSAGEAGADRAAATLPQGLFLVPAIKREDGAEDADELGDGVWATSFLPQRTRFGPHEGPVIAWGAKVRVQVKFLFNRKFCSKIPTQ